MGKSVKIVEDVISIPATMAVSTTLYSAAYDVPNKSQEVNFNAYVDDVTKVTDTVTLGIQSGAKSPTIAIAKGTVTGSITQLIAAETFTITLVGNGWRSPNTDTTSLVDVGAVTVTVSAAANTANVDIAALCVALNDMLIDTVVVTTGEFKNQSLRNFVEFYYDLSDLKIKFRTTYSGSDIGFTLAEGAGVTPWADLGFTVGTYYGADVDWTTVATTSVAAGPVATATGAASAASVLLGNTFTFTFTGAGWPAILLDVASGGYGPYIFTVDAALAAAATGAAMQPLLEADWLTAITKTGGGAGAFTTLGTYLEWEVATNTISLRAKEGYRGSDNVVALADTAGVACGTGLAITNATYTGIGDDEFKLDGITTNTTDQVRFYVATNGTGVLASGHGMTVDGVFNGPELVSVSTNRPSQTFTNVTLDGVLITAGGDPIYTTDEIDLKDKNGTVKVDVYIADRSKITDTVNFVLQTTQGALGSWTIPVGGDIGSGGGTYGIHTAKKWTIINAEWQDATALASAVNLPTGAGAATYTLTQTSKLLRFVRVKIYDGSGIGAITADSGIKVNITSY